MSLHTFSFPDCDLLLLVLLLLLVSINCLFQYLRFFIKVLFHMVPFAYLVIMVLHDLGCHITGVFGT
jgi:hypothetical protein